MNRGAVFGFAQGHVSVFLAFSVVALGVILWVFATSGAKNYVVHVALGLITAGAIGNLYDRAVFHGVRDMLRFYVSWYPYIFNVADVLLCVGVPLLMLCWIVEGWKQARREKAILLGFRWKTDRRRMPEPLGWASGGWRCARETDRISAGDCPWLVLLQGDGDGGGGCAG